MKKVTFFAVLFAILFAGLFAESCATAHDIGKVGEGCGTRISR